MLQGLHGFGLIVKDSSGRSTQTKFFSVDTGAVTRTIKNVIIPPTIDATPSVVRRGDNVSIIGYAPPGNTVNINIDTVPQTKVVAGRDGSYRLVIPSSALGFGKHSVRARQSDSAGVNMSDFSTTKSFTVSAVTAPAADLNGDGVVDNQDLSIFFARWTSADPAVKKTVDINSDGKVDVTDFSILIRAVRK